MKLPWDRGGLRTYLVLLVLVFCRPDHRTLLWGLPLLLLGAALQVYSKGCLRQDQIVAMGGPYRFVRHPFYAANLLVDAGLALMSGWWPLLLFFPVWWLLVYIPVMRGEERYLSSAFPDTYPAYQRSVSRLIPLRRPLPPSGPAFSWRNPNIVADTVIPRAIRTLTYPLLILACQDAKLYGVRSLLDLNNHAFWSVLALVVAFALAGALKLHLKDGKRILPAALSGLAFRLPVALALLIAAGALRSLETESGLAVIVVGSLAVLVSLVLCLKHRRLPLLAEGLGLIGAIVLLEVIWLAAIPIVLYSALLLDRRLARIAQPATRGDAASPLTST